MNLLVIASTIDLSGALPISRLKKSLHFLGSLGIDSHLLIDPSLENLRIALSSAKYNSIFTQELYMPPKKDSSGMITPGYNIMQELENLGVPVIGSSLSTQLLTNDKTRCLKAIEFLLPGVVLNRRGFTNLKKETFTTFPKELFPVIVKPNNLGGSLGIDDWSVCFDKNQLEDRINEVYNRFPFINSLRIEKYLSKCREFTVSIIGNKGGYITSVTEVVAKTDDEHVIYSEIDKKSAYSDRRIGYKLVEDENFRYQITHFCLGFFQRLNMKDFGKFDILCDDNDNLYVLDVSSFPALGYNFSYEFQEKYEVKEEELLALVLTVNCARNSSNLNLIKPNIYKVQETFDFIRDNQLHRQSCKVLT